MVSEIRIYIEGDPALRPGFGQFLDRVRSLAREKRIRWDIVLCGGRDSSFDAFQTAIDTHPNAFNILLVDSEGPVAKTPWLHLYDRDGWNRPAGISDERCQLMAQAMEAWFVADLTALKTYYGKGFNEKPIPKRKNVEEIDRKDLVEALVHASKNTSKSSYHKVRHGEKILARLDETSVRARAAHCDRLFTMLEGLINPTSTKEESTSGEINPHSELEIQSRPPLSEKMEKKEHEHG
ncbi:MAG: DUF4276 family protein [Isosphaeraceae bacterium]